MKKVSIVVITKNEGKNIADCLNSLINLDYPIKDYEVIIVDSSIDKTPKIVKNFCKRHGNIKFIKSEKSGFGYQRNIGIRKSRFNIIAFTDADCIVPRNWLKVLTKKLDKNVAGVGGNAYSPKDCGYLGKCASCLGIPAGGDIGLDSQFKILDKGVSNIVTCNAAFIKKVLEKVGGFNEKRKYGEEDIDLCERLIKFGYILEYEQDSYVYHKTRGNLFDFVKWNFRRGRASANRSRTMDIFFIILGITTLVFSLFYSANVFIYLAVVLYTIFMLCFYTRKRFSLLLRRRKKIGIGIFSILFTVPLLFLLRRLSIFVGVFYEKFNQHLSRKFY